MEVKVMIFHQISDKSTLRSLALTSVSYYQAYSATRKPILNSVTFNYLKKKKIHLWIENYALTISNCCWEFVTLRKTLEDSAARAILSYCRQAETTSSRSIKLDREDCLALLEVIDLTIWADHDTKDAIIILRGPPGPVRSMGKETKLESRVSRIYPLGANHYRRVCSPSFYNPRLTSVYNDIQHQILHNNRFKQLAFGKRLTRATTRGLHISEHEHKRLIEVTNQLVWKF